MTEELNQLLEQLKASRSDLELYSKEKEAIVEKATSSDNYKIAEVGATNATTRIAEIETKIREIGLREFMNTGEKKFHPKLEVKEFRVVKLVTEKSTELREWLFANFRPALVVDQKKVVDAAKEGNIPTEFYTAALEPRVQIAKEL